jgi:RNA recognition motif-containing protein
LQDFYTKRPRGFAFIEFVDQRDAEDAKSELDGTTLDGRCVLLAVEAPPTGVL